MRSSRLHDGLYDATVDAVNSAIGYIEDESGVAEDTEENTDSVQGSADAGTSETLDMFIPEIPALETEEETDAEDGIPAEESFADGCKRR